MYKRQTRGASLVLVVSLAFVVVLIGIGFFIWAKIIGGGKELQNATDAGNLNVAKQALKLPGEALQGANEVNEFGGLTDDATGDVNLQTFNRLVGKAVIVALNARAEGTAQAKSNAQTLIDLIQGDNGIGKRLREKLATNASLSGFFEQISRNNSTRMLQNNDDTTGVGTTVSYMARTKASNVFLNANQLPNAAQDFLTNQSNIVNKNGKNYIAGYVALVTGLATIQPYAVPLRPGEQPHLVAGDDFQANAASPLGGNDSLIPPNSFRSVGRGRENNRTGADLDLNSCAVAGCLNKDFPASLPRGYIIVDNSGSVGFSGTIGGGSTALSKELMQPSWIELAQAPSGTIIGQKGELAQIQSFAQANKNKDPRPPIPQSMLDAVEMPKPLTSDEGYQLADSTVHQCDNVNSISGGPGPQDPACVANYDKFLALYGSNTPGSNQDLTGLMAVEAFKCYVLQVRASVGSSGCGVANAPGECTGLKKYDHAHQCLPCNFGQTGTLGELLTQTNGAAVLSDLNTRLYQIKPTATQAEINSILGIAVPFGSVSYIYMNATGNLILSMVPPPFPIAAGAQPDGSAQNYSSGSFNLNGAIVNVPECDGYPNPWDCPAVPAQGEDKAQWTPSSGFKNLLGVLKFFNCASGGGNWCCPC